MVDIYRYAKYDDYIKIRNCLEEMSSRGQPLKRTGVGESRDRETRWRWSWSKSAGEPFGKPAAGWRPISRSGSSNF